MRTLATMLLLSFILLAPSVVHAQLGEGSQQIFSGPYSTGFSDSSSSAVTCCNGGSASVSGSPASNTPATGFAVDNIEYLFYIGSDRNVYMAYYISGQSWTTMNMTAKTGAPLAASGGGLTSFKYGSTQGHWCYVATDSHVHEMWWPTGGHYATDDLNAKSGAPNAALGSELTSYNIDNEEFVYYIGTDSHLHLLYSTNDSSTWSTIDITTSSGAPVPQTGTGLSSFPYGIQSHVFYFAPDPNYPVGEYWDLIEIYNNGGPWTFKNISGPTVPVITTLASFVYGSSYRLYYFYEPTRGDTQHVYVYEQYAETNTDVWFLDNPLNLSGALDFGYAPYGLVAFGFPPTGQIVLYLTGITNQQQLQNLELVGTVQTNTWSQLNWINEVVPSGSPLVFGFYW